MISRPYSYEVPPFLEKINLRLFPISSLSPFSNKYLKNEIPLTLMVENLSLYGLFEKSL